MKTIKYLLLLTAAVFSNYIGLQILQAQSLQGQALIDSLLAELPKAKHDTDRAMLFYNLSRKLISIDPDKALGYANNCMQLSQKARFTRGIGYAYADIARVYITKSDFAVSLEKSSKAYDTFKDIDFKQGMGDALLLNGISYEKQGYYAKSIENNFAALKLYEEAGVKTNMPSVYNNLGNNYHNLNEYAKAIDNYNMSLALHRAAGNKSNMALVLDNLASVYKDQGDFTKASEYNLQSIQIAEELGLSALSSIYFNRGVLMEKLKDFKVAYEFYNKALGISKKFDLKSSLAHDYAGIAGLYLQVLKNDSVKTMPASFNVSRPALIEKAHFYFTQALKYSKETEELILMMDCTEGLSQTEAVRGDYYAALDYYKQFTGYRDSVFNDETKDKIVALEKQRLAEVKDKEIQLLSKDKVLQSSEIKRQVLIKNIIVVSVVGIILFGSLLIWSYNRRKKAAFDKQVMDTEMKALRAQMNPHFIFNSLHSINKYVMENDKDNATEYLSRFAKLMRLILENSREQYVTLEQDLQALELYIQLESLRFKNKFQYVMEIDEDIDKENTLVPPLLLQPFVENAVIHGIQQKEGGLIKVKVSMADEMIRCIVEDNGMGRQDAVITGQAKPKSRKSLGLKITQERLDIINHLKKVKTAITFFDVKDEKDQPGGLRVELLLPLQMAF